MKPTSSIYTIVICLILSLSTNTYAQVIPNYVPKTGLQGWWPFNGNANDESGMARHGKVSGATLTTDRFGVANKAYNFNGSSYISMSPTGLPSGVQSRSLSIWVKPTIVNGIYHVIFTYGQSNTSNAFALGINQITDKYYISTYHPTIETPIVATVNQLMHFVITYNSTIYKIYANGVITDSGTMTTNTILDSILVGKDVSSYFIGDVDDIGLWNRALTQSEVTALYNACDVAVTAQPASFNAYTNNDVSFSISCSDTTAQYQWQTLVSGVYQNISNSTQYAGTTTKTLMVKQVTIANDAQKYRCVVKKGFCSDTSIPATLTIYKCNYTILNQPKDITIKYNKDTFIFVTSSDSTVQYQWQIFIGPHYQNLSNSSKYVGVDNDTLIIKQVSTNNQKYRCVITKGTCADTTNPAILGIIYNSSIADVHSSHVIAVFPNPADNMVNIMLQASLVKSEFNIYDAVGRSLISGIIPSESFQLDISKLSAGNYIFNIGGVHYKKIEIIR